MSKSRWERTKELLDAALSIPETQRAEFLATACAGDEALRAELESLLRAHANADGFLRSGDAGAVATIRPIALRIADTPIEGPGDRIGRYKLLQSIGEGGFGEVFMAEQLEPIRRMVALKIIKAGMDTKEVIARFEAERQALALMDHPNIAKVLDAGATDSGRPYFVMELVRGVPITEFCDSSRLPIRARLELFVTVCKAFDHAHDRGIVHRDIKPSNVLVTLLDGAPTPVVIDFGIAKATSHRLTERTLFTMFGQFVGTPTYMSPEQAAMSNQEVDRRSDVYSLGVLLYELMTGTTPFAGEHLRSVALLEMLRAIREVDPPTPSHRVSTLGERGTAIADRRSAEPRALARFLRGDLDWIVMRAMEKDRRRRYASAGEFAADIERHLRSDPVTARKSSIAYRASRFAKRHRRGVVLTVMIVIAGGSILASNASSRISSRRRSAAQVLFDQGLLAQSSGEALEKLGDMSFERAFVRADSAFAEAERKDPSFLRPIVQRATLAHLQARLARFDTARVRAFVSTGMAHINRALVLDPTNADAFEGRSKLVMQAWMRVPADSARKAAMLTQAQLDLEQAVALNPNQAGAWASMLDIYAWQYDSRLLSRPRYETNVLHAAQRALETDSFVPKVRTVVGRLFKTSYDMERFTDAAKFCTLLHQRFPKDRNSWTCQLMLLATPTRQPEIALAYALADSVVALSGFSEPELWRRDASLLVAAVVARASAGDRHLADSARNMVRRATTGPLTRGERLHLAYPAAFVYSLLNDLANGFAELDLLVRGRPAYARNLVDQRPWWFRNLVKDPRFVQLAREP